MPSPISAELALSTAELIADYEALPGAKTRSMTLAFTEVSFILSAIRGLH